jgi:hypothetical protein
MPSENGDDSEDAVNWPAQLMAASRDQLLTRLEQSKALYGTTGASQISKVLAALESRRFSSDKELIRFHEALLFLRAFPPNRQVVRQTEKILTSFWRRVADLRAAGADLSPFDPLEVSGIDGTEIEAAFSFDEIRWLARRFPRDVEIVWDDYEEETPMANTWPRFLPLLEEDAYVEANIPWRRWLDAARGRARELEWLIRRFEQLPVSDREKAELYDSLRIPVRWQLQNRSASRTRNWLSVPSTFYHDQPLLERRDVSLEKELSRPAPVLDRLSAREGERILNMVREVMAVRYRELYGTTRGDPHSVVRADVGRGVVIHLWGLPPDRRLPLRAYVAGMTLKNGVPINYIEAIALFEWMEVGFNTFYTFRNGETAWIYAQALRTLRRLMGTGCISVYPYQIGQGNEEAIESGAFWFYRKLGFRPGRPDLLRLTEQAEQRIARDRTYRTSPRTLRRLAEGHVFYELPGAERGAWDRFSTRNLGIAVNHRMAREFQGDSARIRRASVAAVEKALGIRTRGWNELELQAFENFALVLALIPDLPRWTSDEKRELVAIIRAKAGRNEMRHLHLLQKHSRLRAALLELGP